MKSASLRLLLVLRNCYACFKTVVFEGQILRSESLIGCYVLDHLDEGWDQDRPVDGFGPEEGWVSLDVHQGVNHVSLAHVDEGGALLLESDSFWVFLLDELQILSSCDNFLFLYSLVVLCISYLKGVNILEVLASFPQVHLNLGLRVN